MILIIIVLIIIIIIIIIIIVTLMVQYPFIPPHCLGSLAGIIFELWFALCLDHAVRRKAISSKPFSHMLADIGAKLWIAKPKHLLRPN